MSSKRKSNKFIDVLFEDDHCVILNKPPGLLVIPDRYDQSKPNLQTILNQLYGAIFIVHRLDKDTSGIILFAKNAESHKAFSKLWQDHLITKMYQAICYGTFQNGNGTIDAYISESSTRKGTYVVDKKGKACRTDFTVQEKFKSYSIINLQLYTGRTHQIRVHLQHIGHSVLGDSKYSSGTPFYLSSIKGKKYRRDNSVEKERPLLSRHALHASSLSFIHPYMQKSLLIEAPLPKDMKATIHQLRKWNSL